MATLLNAATSNGAGAGEQHSGPCTVMVQNDSVMDGAKVHIQIAAADTAGDYAPAGREAIFSQPGAVAIDAQGTYYLRAVIAGAGANTSITCETTQ